MRRRSPRSFRFSSLAAALLAGVTLLIACPAGHAQSPQRLPGVDNFAHAAPSYPAAPTNHAETVYAAPPTPFVTTPADGSPPFVMLDTPDEPEAISSTSGARNGVFQKLLFDATWIPAPNEGDFGFTDLSASAVFGFPLPTRESPLLVIPTFTVSYLDGPHAPDLPPRIYTAATEFRWFRPITEKLMADLSTTVGMYSDFEVDDGDALRIMGHGLGIYTWSEQTKLVLGVLYLDRADVRMLPAGGILWKPSDDWNFELIFPKPKIAQRVASWPGPAGAEHWAYLAGEFGGGQWAIESPTGTDADLMVIRDYRLILGYETKTPGGIGTKLEAGYVFGREVEFYESSRPDFQPHDTLLIRVGASY